MVATYVPGPHGPMVFASAASATPTTWNPADQSNIAFTNGNLTVRDTVANWSSVRSIAATTTNQKVYFENTINLGSTDTAIGFSTSATTLTGPVPGNGSPSTAFYVRGSGLFFCGDSADTGASPITGGFVTGDEVDVCFVTATGKFYIRKNNGAWNPNLAGTQNPDTGVGGLAIPFAGPYYAIFQGADSNEQASTRFASASWARSAPSGATQLAS